jgi:hypothetical protein
MHVKIPCRVNKLTKKSTCNSKRSTVIQHSIKPNYNTLITLHIELAKIVQIAVTSAPYALAIQLFSANKNIHDCSVVVNRVVIDRLPRGAMWNKSAKKAHIKPHVSAPSVASRNNWPRVCVWVSAIMPMWAEGIDPPSLTWRFSFFTFIRSAHVAPGCVTAPTTPLCRLCVGKGPYCIYIESRFLQIRISTIWNLMCWKRLTFTDLMFM